MNCVMLILVEVDRLAADAGKVGRAQGDVRYAADEEISDKAEASHQLGRTTLLFPARGMCDLGGAIVGGSGRNRGDKLRGG